MTRLLEKKQFGYSKYDIKFARAGTFKIHGRIHIDKKPFSCSICDKTFRESATLILVTNLSAVQSVTRLLENQGYWRGVTESSLVIHCLSCSQFDKTFT